MALDIEVWWHRPFSLREDDGGLIYVCDELDEIPNAPGVYVFGRMFGHNITPIYIGRAKKIRRRITQHLESNVRLMKAVQHAKAGDRVVLAGEWLSKPGQQRERVLPIVEAELISHALAQGHELVNDKGTRTPTHSLTNKGYRAASSRLFRTTMNIKRR